MIHTRIVTLVLVDARGELLGSLPPFETETPWWQDIAPVVGAVRRRDGVPVTVLRLLDAGLPQAPGGAVTYLAELGDAAAPPPGLRPWHGTLAEHPLRLPWARVGGPQADLAWADAAVRALGGRRSAEPEQIRSWNLSSLWRLPTTIGVLWLKAVPPFLAHEGAILERLQGEAVPRLLARDACRVLLAEVAGVDRYDAGLHECLRMVDLLVDLQHRWSSRVDEALALGLPDWRGPALQQRIAALLERRAGELDADDARVLIECHHALPQRLAAIDGCGLPDTLLHGDCFPGNFRRRVDGGEAAPLTLLDWGDSGVGQPLLDQAAFLDRIAAEHVGAVRRHWAAAWQQRLPQARPEHAAALLAPVIALRQALVYQRFLDGIEDSEHPYHREDVASCLRRTADRLRSERRKGPTA